MPQKRFPLLFTGNYKVAWKTIWGLQYSPYLVSFSCMILDFCMCTFCIRSTPLWWLPIIYLVMGNGMDMSLGMATGTQDQYLGKIDGFTLLISHSAGMISYFSLDRTVSISVLLWRRNNALQVCFKTFISKRFEIALISSLFGLRCIPYNRLFRHRIDTTSIKLTNI